MRFKLLDGLGERRHYNGPPVFVVASPGRQCVSNIGKNKIWRRFYILCEASDVQTERLSHPRRNCNDVSVSGVSPGIPKSNPIHAHGRPGPKALVACLFLGEYEIAG